MKRKIKILQELFILSLARLFSIFCPKKNIWLITEKRTEARDNGYWFYKYMIENHPECEIYFVITRNSPDFDKVATLRKEGIIEPNSWKHCVYYWAAKYNISSQPFGAHPFDYFSVVKRLAFLKRRNQFIVFLQHGIIKDTLSHALDYNESKIDLFCTSTKCEKQAVVSTHRYPDVCVPIIGLCRYDNLYIGKPGNKQILIMPTFRHWLMAAEEVGKPSDAEIQKFMADDFYKRYNALLSSDRLAKLLDQYDYKAIFYPHYSAQCYLSCFEDPKRSKRVILANRFEYDVQQLLKDCSMLITDFSSIFFDFAYMRKPEIYYQFDEEKYRGNHYKEGYFSYKNNGFGPVVYEEDDLLAYIEKLLAQGSSLEEKYRKRIDTFFEYSDNNNCERTFRAIMRISNAK